MLTTRKIFKTLGKYVNYKENIQNIRKIFKLLGKYSNY